MKAVILAGGFGTRISEETHRIPKPMVEIGGKPILWHIMKMYENHGVTDFVVCLGYKGYAIKEFFLNYAMHNSDVSVQTRSQGVTFHSSATEDWNVTLVDTGPDSMTGGRLRRIRPWVDSTFFATYGDGVSDVDITAALAQHRQKGQLATMTTVTPPGRYGAVNEDESGNVTSFSEKPPGDGANINGGFFVLEPEVLDLIEGDSTIFEEETLPQLAKMGQLSAYHHHGFWQAMDTLREKNQLEKLWDSGKAAWRSW